MVFYTRWKCVASFDFVFACVSHVLWPPRRMYTFVMAFNLMPPEFSWKNDRTWHYLHWILLHVLPSSLHCKNHCIWILHANESETERQSQTKVQNARKHCGNSKHQTCTVHNLDKAGNSIINPRVFPSIWCLKVWHLSFHMTQTLAST